MPPNEERRPGSNGAALEIQTSGKGQFSAANARRLAEDIHALGPRALSELLAELATAHGPSVTEVAQRYAAIDPATLRSVLGDRQFPPPPLRLVSR